MLGLRRPLFWQPFPDWWNFARGVGKEQISVKTVRAPHEKQRRNGSCECTSVRRQNTLVKCTEKQTGLSEGEAISRAISSWKRRPWLRRDYNAARGVIYLPSVPLCLSCGVHPPFIRENNGFISSHLLCGSVKAPLTLAGRLGAVRMMQYQFVVQEAFGWGMWCSASRNHASFLLEIARSLPAGAATIKYCFLLSL